MKRAAAFSMQGSSNPGAHSTFCRLINFRLCSPANELCFMDWQLDFLLRVWQHPLPRVAWSASTELAGGKGQEASCRVQRLGGGWRAGPGSRSWESQGSRLTGQVAPRRWGSGVGWGGVGCCSVFWLGVCQIGTKGYQQDLALSCC